MELHILDSKGVIVGLGTCVLARAEQEEEGDHDNVDDAFERLGLGDFVGDAKEVQDQCDREGLDPSWGRVSSFEASQLPLDAVVDAPEFVVAKVFGPHAGVLLADST